MQMSKLAGLSLLGTLLAFSSTQAFAGGCERATDVPTERLYMDLGKVVVQPDAPVGTVLYSQTWTLKGNGKPNYYCETDNNVFVGKLVNPGTKLDNNVYATNIKGIGLRMSRAGATINMFFPGSLKLPRGKITLEGSTFTLEVIKTEEVTGSGVISSGQYTTYDLEGGTNPILETFISADAFSIVSPSCRLLSDRVMNVSLNDVDITEFSGVGSTAGKTPFNIELQCSGGMNENGYVNIHTSFSGRLPTQLGNDKGVLENEHAGETAAKGFGIQVTKENTPVIFNHDYLVAKVPNGSDTTITIPLAASYYQYEDKPTSGDIESHMVYNIDYD